MGLRGLWLISGGGVALGLLAAVLAPGQSGCIYHDTCIRVNTPGHDWCRNLANALQWPSDGSIENAEPVVDADGATPQGCRCFNDAENQILEDDAPACKLEALLDAIENAARQECQSLVLPGYNHNCWQTNGPNASVVEGHNFAGSGSCIGSCEYGGPPSGGSCPDLNPYECATGDDGGLCETTGGFGGADSTGDESGSVDTSAGAIGLDAPLFVSCEGTICEIDRAFAKMLYDDPMPLLSESPRLVYDRAARRHVFIDVEPGSVAYTLGLRTGDRLESVDGTVIDDLEAALHVYAQSASETKLDVRVMRGTQWLDFHYFFVP